MPWDLLSGVMLIHMKVLKHYKSRPRKLWGIMVQYFGQRTAFYPRYLRFKGSKVHSSEVEVGV